MRNFAGVILLAMCSLAVSAQNAPKVEIFGGFSYANYRFFQGPHSTDIGNIASTTYGSGRLSLYGWNGSATVGMNQWFGFTTDFSGYYSGSSASTTTITTPLSCGLGCTYTQTVVNSDSHPKIHNFLFGPQVSYPSGKIRPFAHLLLGGDRRSITPTNSVLNSCTTGCPPPCTGCFTTTVGIATLSSSSTGFAMAFGGGADYSIKHNLAWRLQADYLTNQGTEQNHMRICTGIVWRL